MYSISILIILLLLIKNEMRLPYHQKEYFCFASEPKNIFRKYSLTNLEREER